RPLPCERTIERVLQRNGLTAPRVRLAALLPRQEYPGPQARASNQLPEVDLVGPIHLKGNGAREARPPRPPPQAEPAVSAVEGTGLRGRAAARAGTARARPRTPTHRTPFRAGRTAPLSRRGRRLRRLPGNAVRAAPVGCRVLFGVADRYGRRPPNSSAW